MLTKMCSNNVLLMFPLGYENANSECFKLVFFMQSLKVHYVTFDTSR